MTEALLADAKLDVVACAIDTRPEEGTAAKLTRNLRQGRGGYVLVMALRALFGGRDRNEGETTAALMRERNVPTLLLDDSRSDEQTQDVAELAPGVLVLIAGFGIIGEPLLSLAPHGVLAYHHGDMRRYRGMPPAFWELFNDETEMGVTVQRLSPGLDDGAPVVERSFAIGPRDMLTAVEERIYDGSIDMMRDALHALARAREAPARLASYGDVYTLPNLREWVRFQAKMARRRWRA